MAFRLLTKGAAAAALRPTLTLATRQTAVSTAALRSYSTPSESEPKQSSSIIDMLPGNSMAAKAGYVTAAGGLASVAIAKEIYILNEESLVLFSTTGLIVLFLKYLREPFSNMANEHINRIKSVLNKARDDHKVAVQERIEHVGQMKDLVEVTQALFELSRETAQLEAEAFKLKQEVAVAHEVKGTLDAWVRHERNVREREQKQLATYLIEKIQQDLKDPKVQQDILNQAVLDVEKLARSA
ncbi:uncharacterized protein BYT42DRAFT_563699 [Radiomyces spectabilis]|uniref:uncharacterized protein n=1 Tax=Radiomyces spectabilis TaxID=64574 RepID=UPI0022210253|nr:uncharacterized protein BYT42DRAFT_563699 [Radiomyces spectabilis]KAI8384801.1 hypothetical protein BYT42DRAFT_563699 [Radiomyces spectabilis]